METYRVITTKARDAIAERGGKVKEIVIGCDYPKIVYQVTLPDNMEGLVIARLLFDNQGIRMRDELFGDEARRAEAKKSNALRYQVDELQR